MQHKNENHAARESPEAKDTHAEPYLVEPQPRRERAEKEPDYVDDPDNDVDPLVRLKGQSVREGRIVDHDQPN